MNAVEPSLGLDGQLVDSYPPFRGLRFDLQDEIHCLAALARCLGTYDFDAYHL